MIPCITWSEEPAIRDTTNSEQRNNKQYFRHGQATVLRVGVEKGHGRVPGESQPAPGESQLAPYRSSRQLIHKVKRMPRHMPEHSRVQQARKQVASKDIHSLLRLERGSSQLRDAIFELTQCRVGRSPGTHKITQIFVSFYDTNGLNEIPTPRHYKVMRVTCPNLSITVHVYSDGRAFTCINGKSTLIQSSLDNSKLSL